jgi:excisionase family DNA binding protein
MNDQLLLIAEVANELRTSISTVRHWISKGRLRSIRPGRLRLVRRSDLERFLSSDAQMPVTGRNP